MSSYLNIDVPGGWQESRLESLIELNTKITYGVVQPGPEDIEGVPFIRGGDIFNGKIAINKLRTISNEVSNSYKRTLLNGGELLMSLVGYPGEVAIVPKSLAGANIARQAAYVKLGEVVVPKFIMYYFQSDVGKYFLFQKSTGSAQQVINLVDLKEVTIFYPPHPEQQKIAKILTSVDEVIEKTQAQIDKLKDLKTGMMQELLTNGIGHTEFKDSSIGRIPVEWGFKRLGDIYPKIVVGYVGSVNEYYCEKSEGVPFYRTLNIRDGYIRNTPVKYVTKAFNDKNKKSQIFNEDILIARVGANLGMTCKVTGVVGTANIANAIIIKSVKIASSDFFMEYIRSDMGQRQILAEAAGGAQGVFNTKLAQELMVPVPSLEEQIKISIKLGSLDNIIHVNELKLEKNKATKKALMQDLLTGKVRVKTTSTNTEVAVG